MDIKGSIRFNQQDVSSNLFLNVRGVSGLQTGFHGFHIHENGDCTDPGSHFNPMMVCLNEIINQVSRLVLKTYTTILAITFTMGVIDGKLSYL